MTRHVILFLAANPHTTDPLRLGEQCAAIQRELKMAPHRADFQFESRWAVSVDELIRHLNELSPTVIHFSGHGGGEGGLLLQDEQGQPQPVSARALAMIVDAAAQGARLVVLNACHTAAQAEVLRARVDCVVGMDGAIGDDAALAFATRFYGALGNRRSVGNAVDQGVAALAAKQLRDELLPRCLTRDGMDRYQVFLSPPSSGAAPRSTVEPPGLWRYTLDRLAPRLNGWLRRIGAVATPAEYSDVTACMRALKTWLEHDINNRTKTYVPVHGRTVPRAPAAADDGVDQFVRPIHQVIREILGRSEGGDGVTAEIAAVHRQSRIVRNLARTLRDAREPLILLGDPGTGKSMMLQRVACSMIESELHRVFPALTLYVPLGEFHVRGEVSPGDVLDHVRSTLAPEVGRWLDALDDAGRLVVLFDGMDEMSRDRYSEHTEALSMFAGMRRGRTRTLFSCRITDFSPRFTHQRYVLVPFERGQILGYLRDYFRPDRALVIEGERWPLPRLARRLARRDQAVDASNPFVLWLLCHHLHTTQRWPSSRMELLRSFLEQSYKRKHPRRAAGGDSAPWPSYADCEIALGELAFLITERNLGRAIPVTEWLVRAPHTDVATTMTVGRTLGVLASSNDVQQVRFDHHRLQEYFTALHLCRVQTDVPWLDRLDVPRWQETMVNLVLLGHGDAAVDALADALDGAVAAGRALWEADKPAGAAARPTDAPEGAATSAHSAPAAQAPATSDEPAPVASEGRQAAGPEQVASVEPRLGAVEERLLADRAELAARIVREPSGSPTTRTRLLPVIRSGVEFLMEHGNPITQVKMMRAGAHVADPELMTAVRRPLASKVAWVRAQALMLLAGDARGVGVDLSSEIGVDLARGELLAHLPSYLRAIARSRQPGAAWSLMVALAASLLQLVFFLAIAGTVAWGAQTSGLLEQLFDISVGRPGVVVAAGIVLVAIGSQSWRYGRYQAIATVSATLLLMTADGYVSAMWNGGPLDLVAWLLDWVKINVGIVLLYPELYALQFLAILMVATLYRALTRRAGDMDTSARLRALLGVWRMRHPARVALGILVLQVIIAMVKVFDMGQTIATGAGAVFTVVSVIVGGMALIAVAIAIVFRLFRRRSMKEWLQLVSTVTRTGVVLVLLAVIFSLVVMSLSQLAEFVLDQHGRMLFEVLLILLIVLLARRGILHLRWLYVWIRPSTFPPHSITPDAWQGRLRSSSAARQAELIMRTDHRTLSLEPGAFLSLLEAVETIILSEPALSTYWQHRAELEQVVKQQRQG